MSTSNPYARVFKDGELVDGSELTWFLENLEPKITSGSEMPRALNPDDRKALTAKVFQVELFSGPDDTVIFKEQKPSGYLQSRLGKADPVSFEIQLPAFISHAQADAGFPILGGPDNRGPDAIFSRNMMLTWAAERNKADLAKALIEEGANIEYREAEFEETPLQVAALHGNLEVTKVLVDAGASFECHDGFGGALHIAADGNHLDVTNHLISAGADVNALAVNDGYPIHSAKTPEMARALIAAGASISVKDSEGRNVIQHAVNYSKSTELVGVLADAGADVNCQYRSSPLYLAKSADMVDLLVSKGADVNLGSLLIPALDNPGKIDALLRAGADPNVGHLDLLPLPVALNLYQSAIENEWATHNGTPDTLSSVCESLIKAGADPNVVYEVSCVSGYTYESNPLFTAAACENDELVRVLLDAGANENAICRERTLFQATPDRFHEQLQSILSDRSLDALTPAAPAKFPNINDDGVLASAVTEPSITVRRPMRL